MQGDDGFCRMLREQAVAAGLPAEAAANVYTVRMGL